MNMTQQKLKFEKNSVFSALPLRSNVVLIHFLPLDIFSMCMNHLWLDVRGEKVTEMLREIKTKQMKKEAFKDLLCFSYIPLCGLLHWSELG